MAVRGPQWRSLETRVTLLVLVIFLVSALAIGSVTSHLLQVDTERTLGEQQRAAVSVIADDINRELTQHFDALHALAHHLASTLDKHPMQTQGMLEAHMVFDSIFNGGVFATTLDGTVVASLPVSNGHLGQNFMERDFVAAALREGKSSIGRPTMGQFLKVPIVVMAVPIRNSRGLVVGALMGATRLKDSNYLDAMTQSHYGKSGGYVLIARQHRLIVTASDKSRIMVTLPPVGDLPELESLVEGVGGTQTTRNKDGVEVLASSALVPIADWTLVAFIPTAEAFAPIHDRQRSILTACMLVAALASALSWCALRHWLQPLFAVSRTLVQATETGQLPQPFPITRADEIGHLMDAFNQTMKALTKREAQLRESRNLLYSVGDSVDAAIVVIDGEGIILALNASWTRLAQDQGTRTPLITPQAVVGTNYLSALRVGLEETPQTDARQALEGMEAVRCGQLPRFTKEIGCSAEAPQQWLQMSVNSLRGESAGLVISYADIADRKAAESVALQNGQHLREAQKIAHLGSWSWDPESKVAIWSEEMFRILGYEPMTVSPSQELFLSRVDPRDQVRVLALLEESRISATSYSYECRVGCPDGKLRHILCRVGIARDLNDKPVLITGTAQDITERKQIAEELLQAKLDAEKANSIKSMFLAAASHDLRQPLAALSLYVDLLHAQSGRETRQLVEKIQECCTGLSELLADLLEVSKLDAGVVVPKKSYFSIDRMVSNLVSMHAGSAAAKGLKLRYRPCHKYSHTDAGLFQRILGNLIVNALAYTPKGGILLACRRRADGYWMEVWDTGIGIAEEHRQHIFEDFIRLNPIQDDGSRAEGSGLGLSIVAKTARLLGLKVRMHSTVGRGSVFALEMPIGLAPADECSGILKVTGPPPARRIALVDDNAQIRNALTLVLENDGHEVTAAENGAELLLRLGTRCPDIVITDYRLAHGETGFDVIDASRAAFGDSLAALVITGDTDSELIQNISKKGISIQYKPLKVETLLDFVNQPVQTCLSE